MLNKTHSLILTKQKFRDCAKKEERMGNDTKKGYDYSHIIVVKM
jgi:hypothetical protein